MTKRLQRILVCSDAHHPYVDKKAWRCFVKTARATRPDVLVIIGDFIDNYAVSDHLKNPRRERCFKAELQAGIGALDELDAACPQARKIYIEGNHETRLPRYLAQRAPELYDTVTVPELLELDRRGWEWVPYQSWVKIGKVSFTHDVERAGKNAIQQSLADFGDNLVIGHTHRGGTGYLGTISNEQHVCLNVGWLGDLNSIDYKHRAKARREWQHGFGWIEQDSAGVSWAHFIPIIKGCCVVSGKAIAA